jgi:hypothetical protein
MRHYPLTGNQQAAGIRSAETTLTVIGAIAGCFAVVTPMTIWMLRTIKRGREK